MAVNIARIYQGFITIGPFVPGGPEAWFSVVSDPTFVAKSVFYNTQTLILDAVVVSHWWSLQTALSMLIAVRSTGHISYGKVCSSLSFP